MAKPQMDIFFCMNDSYGLDFLSLALSSIAPLCPLVIIINCVNMDIRVDFQMFNGLKSIAVGKEKCTGTLRCSMYV